MTKSKIIVTGGMGYIGSHTVVDLMQNGYEVIIIDNLFRSSIEVLNGIENTTGAKPKFYQVDICDIDALKSVFDSEINISGIIHFAALKFVDESVAEPMLYYRNNVVGLLNVLEMVNQFAIPNFVFSSSCSVYGDIAELPVTESSRKSPTQSPYASSKLMGEMIIEESKNAIKSNFISLRYFNPVGAHEEGFIGESPLTIANNLVPRITKVASGKLESLTVFGSDLPTRDGSCIRDYIHVSDIAEAHTLALQFLENSDEKNLHHIINLGSGEGVTVLELIAAFEKVANLKLKYTLADRRPGDVVSVYSDSSFAEKILGWKPKRNIDDMMRSAWNWELKNI